MPSRNLAPPNPRPRSSVLFLAVSISASALLLAAFIYFAFYIWYFLVHRSRTSPLDTTVPLKLHKFSYRDLKFATNRFADTNLIGKGGSGSVFFGILRDGKSVAVKKLDAAAAAAAASSASSLQAEREFRNELQILGGLTSPFVVTLLGYCVRKRKRLIVYEYMPNRSLQDSLFSSDSNLANATPRLNWERRFEIVLDVARALAFLHTECEPPVIHGDVKPSNVLLDSEFRAKISDFGLSRVKEEGEFGADLFSQELSGNLTAVVVENPAATTVESCNEVDFALALQASAAASSSSTHKVNRPCHNLAALNVNIGSNTNVVRECKDQISAVTPSNVKGKELFIVDSGVGDYEDNNHNHHHHNGFVVANDDELCPSVDHNSKELGELSSGAITTDLGDGVGVKQLGKDWWWKQDGTAELCSKDYVMEWIGSQIGPSSNPDWDEEKLSSVTAQSNTFSGISKSEDMGKTHLQDLGSETPKKRFDKNELGTRKTCKKKHRKMREWWKEEHLAEISKKTGCGDLKKLETKCSRGFKISRFRRFLKRGKFEEHDQNGCQKSREFSFRRGWKDSKNGHSGGSDMWSGDLLSRELSSTTSMRGTLCYVAPEYGNFGYLMEKADIYSFGVLILVIISGRRPLHVLSSPMKLERANLVSWCRQLAQAGNILELVDEKLKNRYNKDQASLCINLALACLQKMPELRPDIGDVVKILKGEMEIPALPFEFSPSPPSKLFRRSSRKQKTNLE